MTEYEVEFSGRPFGFRIVGDDKDKNAIVKAVLSKELDEKVSVGSWVK